MDARTFDQWTVAIAHRPTRRTAFRLLAGGVLGGVLAQRGLMPARAAQRLDSDGDGLFDDDETDVYGTDPANADTDGDGVGDGEEIYNRDQGLAGPNDPLTPSGGAGPCTEDVAARCVTLDVQCGEWPGLCGPPVNCGVCTGNTYCRDGYCTTCNPLGATCTIDGDCCGGGYGVACCFDGVSLSSVCTDVAAIGYVCPGEPVGPVSCAAGLTDCGGECVNLAIAQFNCGSCGNSCGFGAACSGGICGPICPEGLTNCGGQCVNLATDLYNCGSCSSVCFTPVIGDAVCVDGACECDQIACL